MPDFALIGVVILLGSIGLSLILLVTPDRQRPRMSVLDALRPPSRTAEPISHDADPSPVARRPRGPSLLANPAALAPTGSPAGRTAAADAVRSLLLFFCLYGILQAAVKLAVAAGLPATHAPMICTEVFAGAAALTHFVLAFMHDNTPRA